MKSKFFLAAIISLLCTASLWASDTSVDGIYYNFDNENLTASVTYKGDKYDSYDEEYSGAVVIPSEVSYNGKTYSVTSIDSYAFRGCSSLTSIEIPNSVTRIGDYAFNNCTSLTSIEIPNSVTDIGRYAFSGCSGLTSIEIPNSVTSIRDGIFSNCSHLSSVKIPNNVPQIGFSAFLGCIGLTSIEIPNSVTSIASSAFSGCTGLTSIEIPSGVTQIGINTFSGCTGLTSIEIPNSVTSIGHNAFTGCTGLTSIKIPNSVTSIEDYTFSYCSSITFIEIPNNITSIREGAFENCSNLSSIKIPNSVGSIGKFAFRGCSSLPVVDNIRYADTYLVEAVDKNLTTYNIKERTRFIGDNAFIGCYETTKQIISYCEYPPIVTDLSFNGLRNLSKITLFVYDSSVDLYKNTAIWKEFNIKPISQSGLETLTIDNLSNTLANPEVRIYNVNGMEVTTLRDNLPQGVYILRLGNQAAKVQITER